MMILVTGGTGSFGHALADVGYQLRIYSRDEEKQRLMRERFPQHDYVVGDVRDAAALSRAARGCDQVIHAAALKQVPTGEAFPSEVVRTNINGTENVASLGLPFVILSTDKAVEPVNAYGASKMLAERVALAAGGSVVRYGNVVGSRGSIVPVFREQMRRGDPLTITDPNATRFVMTLDDALQLVALAMKRPGLYIKRDAPAATVGTFADALAGTEYPRVVVGLRPGEKLHEKLDDGLTSDTVRRLSADELWAYL